MGIYWHDILDSTNNEAFRHIDSATDFDVWAASFQTDGRGQKGNRWESSEGENLTFSILARPVMIKAEKQFLVSQCVALGITDYLRMNSVKALIKWPNDIYTEDKKICGILIEHYLSSDNLSVSIIGIGINLNQTIFSPDAPNPTSLFLETGVKRDPANELMRVISCIKPYFEIIYAEPDGEIVKEIEERYREQMYLLGKKVRYQDCLTGEIFQGTMKGVDKSACLILQKEDGSMRSYAFKEIKYLL